MRGAMLVIGLTVAGAVGALALLVRALPPRADEAPADAGSSAVEQARPVLPAPAADNGSATDQSSVRIRLEQDRRVSPAQAARPPIPDEPDDEADKPDPSTEAERRALARAVNEFGIALYKRLAEKETGDVLLSPYSISSALTMTYAGARGETAKEMARVLRLPNGLAVHRAAAGLRRALRSPPGAGRPRLLIANSLWVQQGWPIEPAFVRLTEEHYRAGLQRVDFAGDKDGSRRSINSWVERHTYGRIRHILNPQDMSKSTRMVLANALYLQAEWVDAFSKKATHTAPFWVTRDRSLDISMMRTDTRAGYLATESIEVVRLPYQGRRLAMLVVLPKHRDQLSTLERAFSVTTIEDWMNTMQGYNVLLSLPRFNVRKRYSLSQPLSHMGMGTAMGVVADWSGLSGKKLQLSSFVHQANITVTEKGTEAAAATATGMGVPIALPELLPTARLTVDRPFLYMIIERQCNTILLLGKVVGQDRHIFTD